MTEVDLSGCPQVLLAVPDTEVSENTSLLLEQCFRIRSVTSKAVFCDCGSTEL
ncbi:hypothetical protein EI555_013077, partial [Monodon monoceros]